MGTELFDAEIKTRVSESVKRTLEGLAADRQLDTSDIVREALREYLNRVLPRRPSNSRKAVPA